MWGKPLNITQNPGVYTVAFSIVKMANRAFAFSIQGLLLKASYCVWTFIFSYLGKFLSKFAGGGIYSVSWDSTNEEAGVVFEEDGGICFIIHDLNVLWKLFFACDFA